MVTRGNESQYGCGVVTRGLRRYGQGVVYQFGNRLTIGHRVPGGEGGGHSGVRKTMFIFRCFNGHHVTLRWTLRRQRLCRGLARGDRTTCLGRSHEAKGDGGFGGLTCVLVVFFIFTRAFGSFSRGGRRHYLCYSLFCRTSKQFSECLAPCLRRELGVLGSCHGLWLENLLYGLVCVVLAAHFSL